MGHIDKVVVVGAGISGLASAYRLQELGIRPLVLEADGIPGGVISTVLRNGFVFEGGPQFPRFPEPLWGLIRALQIESEFIVGDRKAKRFILREGRLHRAPFSAGGLLSTGLVSGWSKIRLLGEVFRNSRPPEEEESLADFVQRKFGQEILDYLVDPFISTIFFGDASKMGMQSAFPALVDWEKSRGSVTRGAINAYKSRQKTVPQTPKEQIRTNSTGLVVTDALPVLGSFRLGMSTLSEKLAGVLKEKVRFGVKVESVSSVPSVNDETQSAWRLQTAAGEEIFADAVIIALPAYAASPLVSSAAAELGSLLGGIEHAALQVVSTAYKRNQVQHSLDGFGFMVPRREGLHTICVFWNSSLFPEHAPDGTVLMTSYARSEVDHGKDDFAGEVLSQKVEAENAKILGITGSAVDRMVWEYPQALPQYAVGHLQKIARIRQILSESPGLYLAGNFLNGRSIGDCVDTGFQAAAEVRSHLQVQGSNAAGSSGGTRS